MPAKTKSKRSNKKTRKTILRANSRQTPAASADAYRGPIHVHRRDDGILSANLSIRQELPLTTVAGTATFNTVFTAAVVLTATDWTNYRALYQEFRVLGMEMKFLPKFRSNWNESTAILAGTYVSPLYLAPYHGDATALASEDAAVNHQMHKCNPVNEGMTNSVRMKETDEAQWFSTTSGTCGIFGIKTFLTVSAAVAAATISFGSFHTTFAVEFRGRVVSATQVANNLFPSLSICTSTETKQQVPQEIKQKLESPTHSKKTKHF